jgi:hypothetical protein
VLFNLGPHVRDPDADKLKFRKVRGPEWMSVAGTGEITGVPEATDAKEFDAQVEVTDGRQTVTFPVRGRANPRSPASHRKQP